MLFVTHRGGGTERHAQHMAALLESNGIPVFFCRIGEQDQSRLSIEPWAGSRTTPTIETEQDVEDFVAAVKRIGVVHVHIHHLADFPESASDFFREA